jgi:chromosome segregation ATPase
MTLQKYGVTLVDAMRASSILPRLDELSIGINELAQYVDLSKKLATAHGISAAELVESALRLSKLEKETGKPFHEVVREFEDKQDRVEELGSKVKQLDSQRVKIQGELSQTNEKLFKTLQELKHAISTKEQLQRLGLEKTATLTEFIEDYELLGFDAQEVQRLAKWRKSLVKIGIDPDKLESFIEKKGSLEKQLRSLEEELSQGKARLKILATMERETRDIQRIRNLMNMKKAFACGHCGSQIFYELTRIQISQCLAQGRPITIPCQRCGAPNTYNTYEVLARLGFEVLS